MEAMRETINLDVAASFLPLELTQGNHKQACEEI